MEPMEEKAARFFNTRVLDRTNDPANPGYVKTTTAAVAQRANASTSSKVLVDAYGLIEMIDPDFIASYDVHSFLSNYLDDNSQHKDVVEALHGWLKKKLSSFTVETEKSLGDLSKHVPQIFTREKKVVDVVIMSGSVVIVQFEVVSNKDVNATRLKLAFGLCDQLRYFMNHSDLTQNMSVCGFVVPVNKMGMIEFVECSWDYSLFKYKVTVSSAGLQESDIITRIAEIAVTQKRYLDETLGAENKHFTVPLAITEAVKNEFGNDVQQLKSGVSIVLCSKSTNMVYKKCFDLAQDKCLLAYIVNRHFDASSAKEYVCFPTELQSFLGIPHFIKFPLLMPPITRLEARQHLEFFCHSVSNAITEMHTAGLAHLDIRLENICFKSNDVYCQAVLVDLDRSAPAAKVFEKFDTFGISTMYEPRLLTWTNSHMDWKQFGILLYSIVNEYTDYHEIKIPVSEPMGLLEKLFHSGEFDRDLLEPWIKS